jgi:hypothetical protein
MYDRIISSLVAVSLALLVWLYARSRDQEVLDNVPIPVQVRLAEGQADNYSLEVAGPAQAVVSFTGPPERIHELRGLLQRNELHIDLTLTVPEARQNDSRYSDTVRVEASDVPAPPGVTPILVEGRNRIAVTVHRLVDQWLPVAFNSVEGPPPPDLAVEPKKVRVRGPQEVLERARCIPTEPSELPSRPAHAPPTADAVGRVPLVQKLEDCPVRVEPAKVTVRVPPQLRKEFVLPDVPVHFLCPAEFTLRPEFFSERDGRVTVRVTGPTQDEPPTRVYVYVDLTHGQFLSGANHEPLQLQLPPGFQPADDRLPTVTFNLQPADFIPKGSSEFAPKGLRSPP